MFDMPHELLQKHEDEDLPLLLEQTVSRYLRSDAQIIALEPLAIGEHGGMSGAALARYRVTYHSLDGEANAVTLITKRAHLRERKVLALLSAQRQAVPFSHTLDLLTDEPRLLCQQDLSGDPDEQVSLDIVQREAERLARIHSANLDQAEALSWLPRMNRSYFEEVIVADFHRQLAKAIERPGFVAEYADIARQMEQAVDPFLATMEELREDGPLTLIHGDMHNGNIRVHGGHPYFLDWEHACYGPLYLDLPNHFMPADALRYRDALAALGCDIPRERFLDRYQQAGRYVGFKYMGFLLHSWMNGWTDSLRGPLLDQLLHGGGAKSPA